MMTPDENSSRNKVLMALAVVLILAYVRDLIVKSDIGMGKEKLPLISTTSTVQEAIGNAPAKNVEVTTRGNHQIEELAGDFFEAQCDRPLVQRYTKGQNRTVLTKNNSTRHAVTQPQLKRWCLDNVTNTYRYFQEKQSMRRRTLQGAQRCLANKHLFFMGNSVVRYQYLSMLGLLSTGEWSRCLETPRTSIAGKEEDIGNDDITGENKSNNEDSTADDGETKFESTGELKTCGLSYAHLHKSFNDFFEYTSHYLNVKPMRSGETCFCYRGSSGANGTRLRNEESFNKSREQRYFQALTPFGPVKMTFFSNFFDQVWMHPQLPPLRMKYRKGSTLDIPLPVCQSGEGCNPETQEIQAHSYSTKSALEHLIPKLGASHLFVSGWLNDDIGCTLTQYQVHGCHDKCKTWYMSHTNIRSGYDKVMKQSCGVPVFNKMKMTFRLPRYLYFWDGIHMTSSVNQEFNQLLMNEICGS